MGSIVLAAALTLSAVSSTEDLRLLDGALDPPADGCLGWRALGATTGGGLGFLAGAFAFDPLEHALGPTSNAGVLVPVVVLGVTTLAGAVLGWQLAGEPPPASTRFLLVVGACAGVAVVVGVVMAGASAGAGH